MADYQASIRQQVLQYRGNISWDTVVQTKQPSSSRNCGLILASRFNTLFSTDMLNFLFNVFPSGKKNRCVSKTCPSRK
jgi:hypothetical protein